MWFFAGGVALTAGAVAALAVQKDARACSREMISDRTIPGAVQSSQIVAIGTFTAASERDATFRVDEALRGATAGQKLSIDNRTAYTQMMCTPYAEPFHEGFRFSVGQRKVLILEKQVDGLWQVGFFSDAAWDVPGDDLQPMLPDFWDPGPAPPSLETVRSQVRELLPLLNADAGFEARTPCNFTAELRPRIADSTLVVIADLEPGSSPQAARIVEVLAGTASADAITLNFRVRRTYAEGCSLVLDPPRDREGLGSGRFLLFLRPDEFGIAEYRPALWGSAFEPANEQYLTRYLPTLNAIRLATRAHVEGDLAVRQSEHQQTNSIGLLIFAVLLAAVTGWVIYLSRKTSATPR